MVIIIGAGLTGLTTAWELKRRGIRFQLLEASPCAGGNIRTIEDDGVIVEFGPNSLQATDETMDWIKACGLGRKVVKASSAASTRWLLRNGVYKKAPSGPVSLLFSNFFSASAKWKILRESSVAPGTDPMESVDQFFRRRVGDEVTEYALYPFVSGIYAGNPQHLVMQYAFPGLYRAEHSYGSLMKGLRKGPSVKRTIITFTKGLGQLVDTLVNEIEDHLHVNTIVQQVSRTESGWEIVTNSGTLQADAVVSCIAFSDLQHIAGLPQTPQSTIDYPHVAVVATLYNASAFPKVPEGFGALHTPKESPRTLGIVFSSSVFPHRAPKGKVLLTTFVGGAMNPGLAAAKDDEILARVDDDHRTFLQVSQLPERVWLHRWYKAIPQYGPSAGELWKWAASMEAEHWYSGGNWIGGISLPDCIGRGRKLAENVAGLYR